MRRLVYLIIQIITITILTGIFHEMFYNRTSFKDLDEKKIGRGIRHTVDDVKHTSKSLYSIFKKEYEKIKEGYDDTLETR